MLLQLLRVIVLLVILERQLFLEFPSLLHALLVQNILLSEIFYVLKQSIVFLISLFQLVQLPLVKLYFGLHVFFGRQRNQLSLLILDRLLLLLVHQFLYYRLLKRSL